MAKLEKIKVDSSNKENQNKRKIKVELDEDYEEKPLMIDLQEMPIKVELQEMPIKVELQELPLKVELQELPKAKRAKLPPLVPIQANNKFVCHWCHKKFASKNDIATHLKHQHPTNDNLEYEGKKVVPDFVCMKCQKEFSTQRQLENHLNQHERKLVVIDAPFTCAHCGCPFQRKTTWVSHSQRCGHGR